MSIAVTFQPRVARYTRCGPARPRRRARCPASPSPSSDEQLVRLVREAEVLAKAVVPEVASSFERWSGTADSSIRRAPRRAVANPRQRVPAVEFAVAVRVVADLVLGREADERREVSAREHALGLPRSRQLRGCGSRPEQARRRARGSGSAGTARSSARQARERSRHHRGRTRRARHGSGGSRRRPPPAPSPPMGDCTLPRSRPTVRMPTPTDQARRAFPAASAARRASAWRRHMRSRPRRSIRPK